MLRNGILEAFSGIIQGMGQAKADQYLKAQVRFEFETSTLKPVSRGIGWIRIRNYSTPLYLPHP